MDVFSDLFKPFFTLDDEHEINIMCDMPHLLKNIRRTLAIYGYLIDKDGGRIDWKIFKDLVELRTSEGFNFTHKMTSSHINWVPKKMKVDIAMQTFSQSTADSMRYLMQQGHPKFIKAGPTIRFTEMLNNLVDIFNTKHKQKVLSEPQNENLFKEPIHRGNKHIIYDFFETAIEYLKGMQIVTDTGARRSLIRSPQNAGFKGFIINMYSLRRIVDTYVEKDMIESGG